MDLAIKHAHVRIAGFSNRNILGFHLTMKSESVPESHVLMVCDHPLMYTDVYT